MIRKLAVATLGVTFLILSGCGMNTNNNGNNTSNNLTGTSNVSPKTVVSSGDMVGVDYVGKLENGTIFDTSVESEAKKAGTGVYNPNRPYKPLEFKVGAGQMIPGFDKGVVGMKLGESKTLTLQPAEAYGEYDNTRFEDVKKSDLKPYEDLGIKLEAGSSLPTQYGSFKILSVSGDVVRVDTNHELAGKVLIFEVTVRDIK